MLQVVAVMLMSQQALQPVAEGKASYYTMESSGRVTASGDVYDDALYTCAMRKGNFGDYFLVVAENGKSVVVRLNDRGPYAKGRVIDLSEAAMRKLQGTKHGVLKVKVFPLDLQAALTNAGIN